MRSKGAWSSRWGPKLPVARRLFHEHVRAFFINLNAESIETLTFQGEKWYRVKTTSEFPQLLVGIKDSYLVIAVGEESPAPIVRRMNGPVPAWLAAVQRLAAFERPTGMTYINLRRLREASAGEHDRGRQKWFESVGLAQSPWIMSASGLVGPDVVTKTFLPIEGEPRGLLLPAAGRGLQREDLAAIPRDATIALAARLDLQKTFDAVASATRADPDAKEAALRGLGPFQSLDESVLPPDIFKSLGDRWCFYNSPGEGGLVLTGLTGTVAITDRQHFSKNYEALSTSRHAKSSPGRWHGHQPSHPPLSICRRGYPLCEHGRHGVAPAWWAGDKQLVFALAPQNVKAYVSRPAHSSSLADVTEISAELSGGDPLLAIGYLDAPRLFQSVYPLLMFTAPSYLGAAGMSEGRRDLSAFPSLPAVCRHLRPGVATLRRTKLGLELTSRGSMPGFGLAAPVMFLAWDSQWLNLVFGEPENNVPPVPLAVPGGPILPPVRSGRRSSRRARAGGAIAGASSRKNSAGRAPLFHYDPLSKTGEPQSRLLTARRYEFLRAEIPAVGSHRSPAAHD